MSAVAFLGTLPVKRRLPCNSDSWQGLASPTVDRLWPMADHYYVTKSGGRWRGQGNKATFKMHRFYAVMKPKISFDFKKKYFKLDCLLVLHME